MKKIEKIKDFFIKNNINELWISNGGGYSYKTGKYKEHHVLDFHNHNEKPKRGFSRSKILIKCVKNSDNSYLIDLDGKYQKIGNYDKGEKLTYELRLYFDNHKYNNSIIFIDSQKQTYHDKGEENIKKYEDFWEKKMKEYPELANIILKTRFEHNIKKQRALKIKALSLLPTS